MSVARTAVVVGSGVLVGVLGVLIRFAGMTRLIAGYDPDRVTGEEGLAEFVGANALYVAALTVLVGVADYAASADSTGWYWLAYLLAVLALAVRMIRGARRFETDAAGDGDG